MVLCKCLNNYITYEHTDQKALLFKGNNLEKELLAHTSVKTQYLLSAEKYAKERQKVSEC